MSVEADDDSMILYLVIINVNSCLPEEKQGRVKIAFEVTVQLIIQ